MKINNKYYTLYCKISLLIAAIGLILGFYSKNMFLMTYSGFAMLLFYLIVDKK